MIKEQWQSGLACLAGLTAVTVFAGCEGPVEPNPAGDSIAPRFQETPAITRMRGAGTLGYGEPTSNGGESRQYFDFNVGVDNGVVNGTLVYIDYAVIKEDGEPAELRVGSRYPGTAILSFTQTSTICVTFTGTGYLINTGELLAFEAEACDRADPGVDADYFGMRVRQRLLTHGGEYYRADLLSSGNIERTLLSVGTTGITQMTGTGTLGLGEPTDEGVFLQEFAIDVGVKNGVVGGTLDYTDHSVVTNGKPAHIRAGTDEPGTAVANFVQVSETCVDFSGVGKYVNTGELLRFRARACDNGSPGVDVDVFGIWIPASDYQRGPDNLSDGDLVATVHTA